jgi:hypothetical protein
MAPIREWYGLYSIMYNWIEDKYGYNDLVDYWKYIAGEIYTDVAENFKQGGFPYICDYFKKIIEIDEGVVEFELADNHITIDIKESPDYKWQKFFDAGFSMPRDHYFRVYEVIYGEVAKKAGLKFEMLRYDPTGKLKFAFYK